MFTGIIQKTGFVASIKPRGDAILLSVSSKGFFEGCSLGDSIANDGVCLTIESCNDSEATFCIMHQTLENTTFRNVVVGQEINLEKACSMATPMGGHFVTGHVDSIAKVIQVLPRESGVEVLLEIPENLKRYVISRGSVALNGISLTVAEKHKEYIRVCIIPETLERTNLSEWKENTLVNIEVDMLGKYMENYLKEMLKEVLLENSSENLEPSVSASELLKSLLQSAKKG